MRTSNRQAGFSLTEMLVATAIGAFGLVAVAALIGHGIQLQANARSSSLGVNLAVAEFERLRTLPPAAPERADGGSLTANTASHFVIRGQTTVRWVVADGPACGPPVVGGPVACAKSITVRAIPRSTLAAASTVQGLVWR
ncbi:MAG TPA: prepilin-type N-terminal cleavage/methylation domain-containing protein [Vicinamibacterales bacterium]|nr:prepilin-type N-terminal cleavage/methylation domain-containing protein [Vicinamibacterales bacterium]